MRIINIEIKARLKEIEKCQDYYKKVKDLCELAGYVAFCSHTKDGTHEQLKKAEELATDTIETIIKKHNL